MLILSLKFSFILLILDMLILQVLKSPNLSRRPTDVQKLTDLITVHADTIQDYFLYLNGLWSIPIIIGLALFGLYLWIGLASFCGFALRLFGVFMISVVQPALISRIYRKVREPAAKDYHDVMQATLKGIKVNDFVCI